MIRSLPPPTATCVPVGHTPPSPADVQVAVHAEALAAKAQSIKRSENVPAEGGDKESDEEVRTTVGTTCPVQTTAAVIKETILRGVGKKDANNVASLITRRIKLMGILTKYDIGEELRKCFFNLSRCHCNSF